MRILTLLHKFFVFLIIFGSVTFHLANGKAHAGTIYDAPDSTAQMQVANIIDVNETPDAPQLSEPVCSDFSEKEVKNSNDFFLVAANIIVGCAIGGGATFFALKKRGS